MFPNESINDHSREETRFTDALDEAGNIGEEQLPSAEHSGRKTDKQVWNYSADEPAYTSSFGERFRNWLKGQ